VSDELFTAHLAEARKTEPMMRHFRFAHLRSERMRELSAKFASLALALFFDVPGSAERTVALRKLLEAKDAAVRCVVDAEEV
jgi:hypothetical protein